MSEKTITPFTDLPYEAVEALSQYLNATGGAMSGFRIGKGGFRGGDEARQVGAISEKDNERFYVGTPDDPLVLLGQLYDKTGVDEYGLWVKSGAAYIAGMRLFEAVVDPDGNGDYATIAAAIAAGKKSIFLRKGTHILSADLSISTSNTVLVGESRDETVIQSGATEGAQNYQISISGHYCRLINLKKTKLSTAREAVIISGNNCKIDRLYVTNEVSGGKGVSVSGSKLEMKNSEIYSDYAIYDTGNDNDFVECKLKEYTGSYSTAYLNGSEVYFSGNYVYGTKTSTTDGVVAVKANLATIKGNYIEGGGAGDGIYVSSNYSVISDNKIQDVNLGMRIDTATNTSICNNLIYNIGGVGVMLGYNTSISEFNFLSNTIMSTGGPCIQLRDVYNANINNNHLSNGTGDGIDHVSGNVWDCNINDNQIVDCTVDGITGGSSSTFKYNNVMGNNTYGNGGRGLNISASYCNIIGNTGASNTSADSISNTSGNTYYNI